MYSYITILSFIKLIKLFILPQNKEKEIKK
jgi:hypothetical protein